MGNQTDLIHSTGLDKKRGVSLLYNVHSLLSSTLYLSRFSRLFICLLGALSFSCPFMCRSFHSAIWLRYSFNSYHRRYLHRPLYAKARHPFPRTSHYHSYLSPSIMPAHSPPDLLIALVSVLSHALKLQMPKIPFQHSYPQYVTTTSTTPSSLHYPIIIIPKTSASRQKVLYLLFPICGVVFYTYFVHSFGFVLQVWKRRWKG